ncbi:MAG: hypothetical protein AUI14_02735 [Actinobacteria bacterium 13_2_20CM_2_71_6]|nr:MAG: hypothetical protein AUI14_02735 [Actinobacteria bacterium 13_2_20CM_2_71_6]
MSAPDEPPAGPDGAETPGEAAGEAAEAGSDSGAPRSGLRNPSAAVRGVGAGALVVEALVLLMAIVPLVKLSKHGSGGPVAAVLVLALLCVVLAGLLRYRWAWYAGIVLQVALFACGLLNGALAVLGLLFGGVWAYVLSVRRRVLGTI